MFSGSLLWIRAIISFLELGTLGRGSYVYRALILESGKGMPCDICFWTWVLEAKLSYGADVADVIQSWMDDI